MMEILIESEAAKYLKVPEKTLRNLRYKGKIPSGKIGGVVQYKKSDLDDFQGNAFKKGKEKWAEKAKDSSSKNIAGRPSGTLPASQAKPTGSARMKKAARKLSNGALSLSLSLIKDANKRTASQFQTA